MIAWVGASLLRSIGASVRLEVDDRCGLSKGEVDRPVIWLFWHNRVLLMPYVYKKLGRTRLGTVLTSPSGDGEIIARIVKRFGFDAVRGSSNKRPAAALRELARCLKAGSDVAITPDGPRGPRYCVQPGAIKLAQLSGCPLMAVHVQYRASWAMKTWDGFLIPRPFTQVKLTLEPLVEVPRDADKRTLEEIRSSLESRMRKAME